MKPVEEDARSSVPHMTCNKISYKNCTLIVFYFYSTFAYAYDKSGDIKMTFYITEKIPSYIFLKKKKGDE
jgi:hypothetical protein